MTLFTPDDLTEDEINGWARERVRALDDRLKRQNGTVIMLPYKKGEGPNQETDLAPSLSSPEARQVEPDV